MKYLRRVLGVTKRERMRNIRLIQDMEIHCTMQFIEQRQLSWREVMEEKRLVRKTREARTDKNKKRGR